MKYFYGLGEKCKCFYFFLETRNMDRNVLKQTPLSALLNTNLGAGEKLSVIIYS